MTSDEAHAVLGLAEGSNYDLVAAKNKALKEAAGDDAMLAKVRE